MRSSILLVAALLLAACLAPAARADTVHLRDGRKLQGETTWSPDGKRLEIKTRYGGVVVDKDDVLRIEAVETPEQELARRRAALAADDLPGRVALAELCLEHRLERDAAALLLEVVAAEPIGDEQRERLAPAARDALRAAAGLLAARLDYHLVDGRWVAPEDYYPARGYVRHRGRWVKRELVDLVQQLDAAEEEAKQRRVELRRAERALEPARRGVDEANDALRRLERALANLTGEKRAAEVELEGKAAARRTAEERVERAQRSLEVFVAAGSGDPAQLLVLQADLAAREGDLDRARRTEEQARARVAELARLEAQGPQLRAEAEAGRERALAAQVAAQRALEEARDQVERSARRAVELGQQLEAMKRQE